MVVSGGGRAGLLAAAVLVVAVAMRDCSAMVGARPELAALEVEVAELELERNS